MILAATGHRPDKLFAGGNAVCYSHTAYSNLMVFATKQLAELPTRPTKVVTGMALGWDTAVAEACLALGIPFLAAVPFDGQESRWPIDARLNYRRLLARAAEVHYVCQPGYDPAKMQRRNEWMVNYLEPLAGDAVLALWDGSDGGTANCVRYAMRPDKQVQVINCWPEWKKSCV